MYMPLQVLFMHLCIYTPPSSHNTQCTISHTSRQLSPPLEPHTHMHSHTHTYKSHTHMPAGKTLQVATPKTHTCMHMHAHTQVHIHWNACIIYPLPSPPSLPPSLPHLCTLQRRTRLPQGSHAGQLTALHHACTWSVCVQELCILRETVCYTHKTEWCSRFFIDHSQLICELIAANQIQESKLLYMPRARASFSSTFCYTFEAVCYTRLSGVAGYHHCDVSL